MKFNLLKLTLILLLINSTMLLGQLPTLSFASGLNGSLFDQATAITRDASGNLYITGAFQGTVDFDPSASVATLTSNGSDDAFVAKYSSGGVYQWAFSIGSTGGDNGDGISIDPSGMVCITGYFSGTVDFDPSASTTTLSAPSVPNIFTAKYNSNGQFQWVSNISGNGSMQSFDINTDANGNVYVCGSFSLTADFDPTPASLTFTSQGQRDIFLIKYNSSGALQWALAVGSVSMDLSNGLITDASGNCYITGGFNGTVDFDPSASTATLASTGAINGYVAKYNTNGAYQWAFPINSTGGSSAEKIRLDGSGNIFIIGNYSGVADLDPSAATANFTANTTGSLDMYLAKYNGTGTYLWGLSAGGTGFDAAKGIDVDAYGDVAMSGSFNSLVDFDPSAATQTIQCVGNVGNGYVAKYSASGNYLWAFSIPTNTFTEARSIVWDNTGNLFVTGRYSEVSDFDPQPSTYTLSTTPAGNQDIFLAKYAPCVIPSPPLNVTPAANTVVCANATTSLYASSTGTVNWYSSLTATSAISSGSVFVTPLLAPGAYAYYASSKTCAQSYSRIAIIFTVLPSPTITVNSGTICAGQSFTINPAGALSYSIQGGNAVVSPVTSSVYTVTGTALNGCVSAPAGSTVQVNPLPLLSVNSGTICSGQTFSILPTGAASFTIQGGNAVVSPVSSTSYSVSGTSSLGCTSASAVVCSLSVFPNPTVSLNSGTICSGQSFTLNPTGAASYTLQGGNTIVNPLSTTVYTVVGTSSAGCVSPSFGSSTVTVNNNPTIGVNSGTICSGQSFTLNPTGAASYTIQGGNTIVNPLSTTVYTVVGTSSAGCVSPSFGSSTVTVNNNPTIGVNSGTICSGQSFTLNPTGAASYTLQGGNTIVNPLSTTVYTVVGTSSAGCVAQAVAAGTVVVNSTPTITINSGSICSGQSFTINPTGAASYTIQGGNAVVSPTGTSTYSVTGSSAFCLSAPAICTVVVNPLPLVSITGGNTLICVGETTTLTASGAGSYTWSNGSTAPTIIISPTASTVYTVMGTNSYNCESVSGYTQTVSLCNAINEESSRYAEQLTVYPNPNRGSFVINFKQIKEITIINGTGQEVYQFNTGESGLERINIHQLPAGVYFIIGLGDTKQVTKKLLVE